MRARCNRVEEPMKSLMRKIWREEEGATAVEYALMVALIAVAIIVAVRSLGTSVSEKFDVVATAIDGA